jgi:hypothetical protein
LDHATHLNDRKYEGLISAVSFGAFLIIVGLIFILTPGLWDQIVKFANDITTSSFPFGGANSTMSLLAPAHPDAHQIIYQSLLIFDIAIGALNVFMLALRLSLHSGTRRIAQQIGDIVFWFGAAVLVQVLLLQGTLNSWFQYWAAIIILFGITMIARAIVHFARRY